MRVILLQEVKSLGKKYDIKNVKAGYARNFLIPKGLAKQVTEKTLKLIETQKEIEEKKATEELKKVQTSVSKVDGLEITISIKLGKEGQLFESITSQKIAEKLKIEGFKIKKSQIILEEPIKELGEFSIKISFAHGLEAEISVIVVEEK
ncbi:50S ribosomal protein L9 [Patescibacteria group bacterium]|nr:50S ribosomal protein L9 [Patescibacteria group bacterium]